MKFIIIVLSTFIASCCFNSKSQLTGCDHSSGWCNEIRAEAVKSWKYAQLSKNVYNKEFQYNVDNYFEKLQEYPNDDLDFYAALYRDKKNDDYVLVFRGTDSLADMVTGNRPGSPQNKYALSIFDTVKMTYKQKHFVVAGHSLGGGIAMHLSLNKDQVTAYSFNGSPVFKNIDNYKNDRHSIVEYGELLKLTRLFGRSATQLYTSIGCTDGNPIHQHDMRILATCLTEIAALDGNIEAKESLKAIKL